MGYEDDVHRLAEHLAHLVVTPATVHADELAMVDAARIAVRRLCQEILHDVTTSAPLGESPIADLTTRSVAALDDLLGHDPIRYATPANPDTGWVDYISTTEQGHHWREARRSAFLATHEWEMIHPQARPSGTDAWPITTDIAAMAEATAHAERDLARRHRTAVSTAATQTAEDQAWALGFAAEQVRRLSPPGMTETVAPLPSRRRHLLLRIRSITDTPAGTARLVFLLRSAHHLRPESVRMLARGHAQTLLTITDLLTNNQRSDSREPDVAESLQSLAGALEEVACQARKVRSLAHDDQRPIQQMLLLRDRWRHVSQASPPSRADRIAASTTIRPALAVVTALRDVIERHVDNGTWYHHVRGHRYPWQRTNASTQLRVVETARQAADHADQIARVLPGAAPGSARCSPRGVLAPRLLERDRDRRGSLPPPWFREA